MAVLTLRLGNLRPEDAAEDVARHEVGTLRLECRLRDRGHAAHDVGGDRPRCVEHHALETGIRPGLPHGSPGTPEPDRRLSETIGILSNQYQIN